MATFIEQVQEMGLKQAAIAKLDEAVERMTAGMNINDIRAALRGDEPRRPNPRLRPHADSFWLHIRPSFYHTEVTHIYPTFRLGWLSTWLFVWETLTGIFLMVFYTPSPVNAYENIWNILGNVPLGQLMRNLHRFGAEVMVLVVALHMLRTFITGSYKKPRQFTWATGMILLVLTLMLSFSGYLLPWDQLGYWALTVFLSATEAQPGPEFLGRNIGLLLAGAPQVGAGGLLRWYLLHVLVMPLALGILFFVHYYKVVLHGHSLPPGREEIGEDTAKRVPKDERTYFIPDILTNELMWTALATLILVAVPLFRLYNAPLESHANPLVTPLHVVAPWYLAWSQGWLKLWDKAFVAFGLIPGLLVAFTVMPYFEVGKSRRYIDRRVGLTVSMAFIVIMLYSNWLGSPEYGVTSSAEQEVFQDILPQEGHSELKAVPYDELQPGTYVPGTPIPGRFYLTEALIALEEAIYSHSCHLNGNNPLDLPDCEEYTAEDGTTKYRTYYTRDAMPDPQFQLIIKDYQKNMREIIITAKVEDPANPDTYLINNQIVGYRHQDSNYEED